MTDTKIIGLSNTEDVMWYKLSPGDETLKKIDLIFDIYDNIYEEYPKDMFSYDFHTQLKDMCFHKEGKDFVSYFIFTKKTAHIMIRKVLNWKKYSDEIHKNVDFVE
jgi:hypothetical protein